MLGTHHPDVTGGLAARSAKRAYTFQSDGKIIDQDRLVADLGLGWQKFRWFRLTTPWKASLRFNTRATDNRRGAMPWHVPNELVDQRAPDMEMGGSRMGKENADDTNRDGI